MYFIRRIAQNTEKHVYSIRRIAQNTEKHAWLKVAPESSKAEAQNPLQDAPKKTQIPIWMVANWENAFL